MRPPVVVRRLAYRLAYNALCVYWFVARPTSTGVKCVLTDGERVLLVRHTYGPASWGLPGGGVKRGESPDAAVRRELSEELGIEVADLRLIGTVRARTHRRHDTVHCFHAAVGGPALTIDRGEIREASWFDRAMLPRRLGEYVEQVVSRL